MDELLLVLLLLNKKEGSGWNFKGENLKPIELDLTCNHTLEDDRMFLRPTKSGRCNQEVDLEWI